MRNSNGISPFGVASPSQEGWNWIIFKVLPTKPFHNSFHAPVQAGFKSSRKQCCCFGTCEEPGQEHTCCWDISEQGGFGAFPGMPLLRAAVLAVEQGTDSPLARLKAFQMASVPAPLQHGTKSVLEKMSYLDITILTGQFPGCLLT